MDRNKKQNNKKANSSTGINIKSVSEEMRNENVSALPTSAIKEFEPKTYVHKKKIPISRIDIGKKWNEEDAKKAIFLEQMFVQRQIENQTLVISFPDQSISYSSVRAYSRNIDSVNFPQSFAPRTCYVTLKPGANVNEEISKISKIPFQNGFLKAKLKSPFTAAPAPVPREVDPSTLYVGNLPHDISVNEIKEHFKKSFRIEIGYSLKKKWNRYALVTYKSAAEAMHAFAVLFDSHIRLTSLVLRFHRMKNWNILQQVEKNNELERLKIKKEKVDEEYEAALRKAQIGSYSCEALNDTEPNFKRAPYPIPKPIIDTSLIKKEPITPEHVADEEGYQNVNNWSHRMQYLMTNLLVKSKKPQHDQQDMQQQFLQEQIMQLMQLMQQQDPITDSTRSSYDFQQKSCQDVKVPVPKTTSASLSKGSLNKKSRKLEAANIDDSFQNISNSANAMSSNNTKNLPNAINFESGKIDIRKLPRIPKKRQVESNPDKPSSTNSDVIDNGSIKKMAQQLKTDHIKKPIKKRKRAI